MLIVCAVLLGALDRQADQNFSRLNVDMVGLTWLGMGLVMALFTVVVIGWRRSHVHRGLAGIELLIAAAMLVVALLFAGRSLGGLGTVNGLYAMEFLAPLAGVWLGVAAVTLARSRRPHS